MCDKQPQTYTLMAAGSFRHVPWVWFLRSLAGHGPFCTSLGQLSHGGTLLPQVPINCIWVWYALSSPVLPIDKSLSSWRALLEGAQEL